MVDTYSLATSTDIDRVYNLYKKNLDIKIKIGFHSHNNQLNSFSKKLIRIKSKVFPSKASNLSTSYLPYKD